MPKDTMSIGILFESDEWSDYKLADELRSALSEIGSNASVIMIDMEDPDSIVRALECQLLISRVFASSRFRGHEASLQNMDGLIEELESAKIPMINDAQAHRFEIDKKASTLALQEIGIQVPKISACGTPHELKMTSFDYPSIIKPNCGGRSECTSILHNDAEKEKFLTEAPDIEFIVEEFIEPSLGFLTRIEIIDGDAGLIVKRSVAQNGLSGYHHGSTYEPYDDCREELEDSACKAAQALGFLFGSFDVIETLKGDFFIDANSVSNVSEDCTELLGMDLMRVYAERIADIAREIELDDKGR